MENLSEKHLKGEYWAEEAVEFYENVTKQFVLEAHHRGILREACDCLHRIHEARRRIDQDGGAYYLDRFEQPKSHPALKVEKENRTLFARLIRELGLDISEETRPPGRPGGY